MGTELLITLLLILLCLLLAAFFSASETAITAVSRARIYHLVMEGNKRAKMVSDLRLQKERLIAGIMIGNNTVNIIGASIATDLAIHYWGERGVIYATVIMTLVVVVFGEVLPKTYAIQNAEKLALRIAPFIQWFLRVLHPLSIVLQRMVHGMLRLAGASNPQASNASASDMIRGTIELHHHEGQVVKQDRDMLGGILDLQDIDVGEIMAHRLTMETIDASLPGEEIVTSAVNSSHSRIPLWEGEPDNIIGVLHTKTLIKSLRESGGALDNAGIRRLLVKPWFIPETTSIKSQLHAFRAQRQHLAFVIDEYGMLRGLVTLEDIIEEIVGGIVDEHDRESSGDITQAGGDIYYVRGAVTIRDLNRELGWNLPDDEASTIAGLVIHEAQLIPEIGEEFTFHGLRFTILDKQNNQVTRLRLERLPTIDESGK